MTIYYALLGIIITFGALIISPQLVVYLAIFALVVCIISTMCKSNCPLKRLCE